MLEMVYVGKKRLIGEVIGINDRFTTIQVYESTSGLMPGEPVEPTGAPLSVTLGPGILSNIFDGIERPLRDLNQLSGAFIEEGNNIPSLDNKKKYNVTMKISVGDSISGGQVYATCPETSVIEHRCMLSPSLKGTVTYVVPNGEYTIDDVVAKIQDEEGKETELTLCQKWPINSTSCKGTPFYYSTPNHWSASH